MDGYIDAFTSVRTRVTKTFKFMEKRNIQSKFSATDDILEVLFDFQQNSKRVCFCTSSVTLLAKLYSLICLN